MDRLDSLDAVIYTRQGSLRIGKEIISGTLSCDGRVPACSAVLVHENCRVPPESQRIIIGRVQVLRTGTLCVLDIFDDELTSCILVGSCLGNMESKVSVRVLNVRDERVRLVKGMQLGKVTDATDEIQHVFANSEPEGEIADRKSFLFQWKHKKMCT